MLTHAPATVYRELLSELKRIFGKEIIASDKEFIFQTYIYDRVPGFKAKGTKERPERSIAGSLLEWLTLRPVLEHTLEILKMMKLAEGWQEFEMLANKTTAGSKANPELTVNL